MARAPRRADARLNRHRRRVGPTPRLFRANDLLGAAYPSLHPNTPIRYVGYHPGVVSTGMPRHLPPPWRALTRATFAVLATSVPQAVAPMTHLLDEPPADAFSAYQRKRRLAVTGRAFDEAAAARLHEVTRELIGAG
ncbi:hypothetical protein H8N00_00070 [Streptomyces sp. AC563]|uniref:hypothetical protein n=1 Tax=Streptomyces buecherae TaxID=2763006 RepID=UPI00164D2108|nr:hypothetical protein [Streptomyces buecherae]MBC3987333.1 hypothetical protein [Streptomyces buecherae]